MYEFLKDWGPELYLVIQWTICLVMLFVVVRRRKPSTAMAWLLIIFFQPLVGLFLYFLIGEYRLPRRRASAHARLLAKLESLQDRFRNHPNTFHPQLAPGAMATVRLAEQLSMMPILGGNSATLLTETNDVIDRLIEDIDAAKNHVHLMFYIWVDDATGQRVAQALIRAAQRGVDCRVLVDAVGSRFVLRTLALEMIQNGIDVRAALPVNLLRRQAARLDLRNHRKLAVMDGRIAYTGSQNIVDASYGHKDLAWHDMMVRIEGPNVLTLQVVFLQDWYFETDEILDGDDIFPDPVLTGDIPMQTLPSGPNYPTENYHRLVVDAIHAARHRVVITTPYFVPDDALMQALEIAVIRGVKVDLIIPERCDQILVGAAARSYYECLLEAKVNVHLFKDGLLHSKTVTIDDDLALIGTSNFDIRSFALNFELNLLLYCEQATDALRAKQDEYIQKSRPLRLEEWLERRPSRQVFEGIAQLFSPLL